VVHEGIQRAAHRVLWALDDLRVELIERPKKGGADNC
jgi:hypothetical protein